MSPVVLGPFLACCALLMISGFAKLRDPRATQPAAAAIGVASAVPVVVAFGVVELLSGVAGAVWGGRAAAAVAVMYVVLAGVALRLVRRAPATPCSCIGASNAPATRSHVVLDLAAAVIAAAAARSGGAPLRIVADHPGPALVLGALVGCCVALFGMVLVAGSTEGGGAA